MGCVTVQSATKVKYGLALYNSNFMTKNGKESSEPEYLGNTVVGFFSDGADVIDCRAVGTHISSWVGVANEVESPRRVGPLPSLVVLLLKS